MLIGRLMLVLSILINASIVQAQPDQPPPAKVVKMTSLYWPPYAGSSLEAQGANIAVATAAFKAVGVELEVTFFPWARTLGLARSSASEYSGYLPEYYDPKRAQEFYFSDEIGSGPLGFVTAHDDQFQWSGSSGLDWQALASFRIGTVRGYVNTPEFDAAVERGDIAVEAVESDTRNLVKLLYRRLDAAVMDENVMRYLSRTEDGLKQHQASFRMVQPYLDQKPLYACFKRTNVGKLWRDWFNEGLRRIDVQAVFNEALNSNLK
ncbi:substrate-binding periplasmic protein [Bermanella sp. R86531]|uniref:substrate-binding periplasmic protein n=2 Tax=unclassified Bermanella TaxID=2627862 RepID=UPI0037C8C6D8